LPAQGLLALLDEDEPALQAHALRNLHLVIDQNWAEVANKVPRIEEISEDPSFAHRELAAAVASRCFFHLEEYNDALRLALGAGAYFDVAAPSLSRTPADNQYVDTLVSKCIGERESISPSCCRRWLTRPPPLIPRQVRRAAERWR